MRSFRKIRVRLLGEQALVHRQGLAQTTFVGITGSGAKSTTAALLHHLLSGRSAARFR